MEGIIFFKQIYYAKIQLRTKTFRTMQYEPKEKNQTDRKSIQTSSYQL
jgi:hypothetical protein